MFFLSLVPVFYAVSQLGFRAMPGLAIVCATALEGGLHGRFLPFYAIAWTCYLPAFLLSTPFGARLRGIFERPPMLFQTAWIIAFIFFLNVTITFRPWILEVPGYGAAGQVVYPTGAVDYLSQRQFHGNAMVPFEYGAYVSWKMYPAVRVSIDSRYEVAYPDWWVDEIFRFYRAQPGWQQTLAGHPTDVVLVRKTQSLSPAMQATDWPKVYSDGAYEIYARPGLSLAPLDNHDKVFAGRFP
jgi:hypothetical protein